MEGRTRYYKSGDPAAYKDFTDIQWKGLSERDKGLWTPYSEYEPASIPQDVLDFTKDNDLDKPSCKEDDKCKKLEARIDELEEDNETLRIENSALREAMSEDVAREFTGETENTIVQDQIESALGDDKTLMIGGELDKEAERDEIKAKLTELRVPFRANTGIVKLRQKLEDHANNTE